MKFFIFKIVLFITLIICFLFYLSNYSRPNHRYSNTISEFNDFVNENKNIDIAIYGSSHAYCSYNPRLIDSLTKNRSFNFGLENQHLKLSKYILEETLKKTSPKLVVLDIYSPFLKKKIEDEKLLKQAYSYYYFNFSFAKLKSILNVFPLKNVGSVIFPVLNREDYRVRLHSNSYYTHPEKLKANPYRGYVGFDLNMKEVEHSTLKEINSIGNPLKKDDHFTKDEMAILYNFIDMAENSNAKILFVTAPYFSAIKNDGNYEVFRSFMNEVSKSRNIHFLDFNTLWHEIDLSSNDFMDVEHLNAKGGNKVSRYLGNYIKNIFDLQSRENENAWIEDQPISLTNFIRTEYENYKRKIDFEITNNLNFESLTIANIDGSKKVIIKLSDQASDSILKKYKLGFHTFVSKVDEKNLMAYSKKKGRLFDAWDFDPEIIEINHSKYIVKSLQTSITSFPEIHLFLYDRSGYKGLIGNKLVIDSVEIK